MTKPLPEWTYAFVAFGIFVFQTLDAIDGKQARRTGSSSPLGQLFDHGCDAISWTVTNLAVISFLGLGISFNSVLSIYASIGPYFFTQLLEYYSGVYVFNIGIIDSTTGQMILIFFTSLPAFFGGDFYFRKFGETFPFSNLPSGITGEIVNRDIAMIVVVYVGVIYSVCLLYKLYQQIEGLKTYVIVTLQLVQHYLCYILMYNYDTSIPFIKEHTGYAYISILFLYCIIVTKVIVCWMSKMSYSFIHLEYLIFVPFFYIQSQYDGSSESEHNLKIAFWATFIVIIAFYARFIQVCINQITDYLGIYFVTIGKKEKKN